MKSYRRYGLFQEVSLALVAFMAFIGGGSVLFAPTDNRPPAAFAVVWLGAVAWMGYWMVDLPRTLTIHDDDTVEFRAVVRTRRVHVRDIVSIKAIRSGPGWVIVRHRSNKIRMHTQFDDFHDFIATLRDLNPNIELRGV